MRTLTMSAIVTVGLIACLGERVVCQTAGADEKIAALKQSLAASQKQLRQYEWIETTIISLKGEEKGRTVLRCYYGADGKLEKLPVDEGGGSQASQPQRGGRGGRLKQRIVENKKDEMKDYMERAAALVHQYVPPSAERIQAVKDAGKVSIKPLDQGKLSLELADYLVPGDKLTIQVDGAASRLAGLTVASYLDSPQDTVTLDVRMNTLPDGTTFNQQVTLNAAAKHIQVVIQNSGYRPLAR